MENKIDAILQPGEVVKWSGRPQDVKLMEAPYGASFIIRVIIAAILLAGGFYFTGPGRGETADPMQATVMLCICVIVALYLVIDPIVVAIKVGKKSTYYITDRRVIACFTKGAHEMTVKTRDIAELNEVTVDKLSTGNSTIYFGKKTDRAARLSRTQDARTDAQNKEDGTPLMFYSVPNAQDALSALPAGLCR